MSQGRLRLFGRFEADLAGNNSMGQARKVQELLSYLLLERRRPVHREKLAGLLWPTADGQHARKYLRQALWQLHKADTTAGSDLRPRLLTVDQDWIKVNPDCGIWVDVFEFDEAHEVYLAAERGELSPQFRTRLNGAVELYRGDLLEGWYSDWCRHYQDIYRSMYLLILDKLMADAEVCGQWESGLKYGRRALEQDIANERTHVRMIRLHCLAGNRAGALRQYDLCARALRDELSVEPEADTTRLYCAIRQATRSDGALFKALAMPTGTEELGRVLSRPRTLRPDVRMKLSRTLHELQRDLARCIQALDR